jgi:ribonucleoside-diphosphate reductase alpha chain
MTRKNPMKSTLALANSERQPTADRPTPASTCGGDNLREEVLRARYLRKNAQGDVIETPDELWRRVATAVAAVENDYGGRKSQRLWEKRFYTVMAENRFLPNSPTLFSAGRKRPMLSACFVLPVPDSLMGILQTTKEAGLIQKSGGGVGFDFSRLRPK